MRRFEDEINIIKSASSISIYGAGDIGTQVAYCLMNAPYNKNIETFLVTSTDNQSQESIMGVPIVPVSDAQISKDSLILVSVLEKYKEEIALTLKELGFDNVLFLTFESDLWASVRREHFYEYAKAKSFSKINYLKDVEHRYLSEDAYVDGFNVYIAKSHKDKKIKVTIKNRPWEKDIQVGAALTQERIADIADSLGDNISEKNANYCELTALYWLWKNCNDDFIGLSHYRRRFALCNKDISYIRNNKVDVVLTIPILNVPSVKDMYEKNHILKDWERLEQALYILYPEYLPFFYEVQEGNYYFAYNMMIMSHECLNNYCEWLFSILRKCEDSRTERDTYQNRYLGFLAERLLSVYVLYHADDLNIVYTDKNFYE